MSESINKRKACMYSTRAMMLFAVCVFFFSCKDDDEYMSISMDTLDAEIEGEKVSFAVESNVNWQVSVDDYWATTDVLKGNGDGTVVIDISANRSGSERSTTLTVYSGSLVETIEIKQGSAYLSLNTNEFVFDEEGTPLEISVSSNYVWNISKPQQADWCDIDKLSGEGDAVITLTPKPYTERVLRDDVVIVFECFSSRVELTVSQEIANDAPTVPVILFPGNESVEDEIPVSFSWEPSVDADNDAVSYEFYLSEDRQTWGEPLLETTDTEITLNRRDLKENTVYYWKVVANDGFRGRTESNIYSFTSGSIRWYEDGEVSVYQTYSAPDATRPVHLVVVGDGFIDRDYDRGGPFDLAAETAIEAFFSIEPYPTYRDYFTVYKVAAFSQERGATVLENFTYYPQRKQTKNTVFKSTLDGGTSTGIACDYMTVFNYAMNIPAITESELPNTTIIVVINLDVYAGTAYMWSNGMSIAMCPTGETLEEISRHEAGGHAFAKLADEYIYNVSQRFPQESIDELNNFRQGDPWIFGANLSLTGNAEDIHWKHYFERDGYEAVGIYEGGGMYGRGVWRPEQNSCMNDNSPYYNAPSREAIVRRIMSINNKDFDYNAFYNNDKIKSMPVGRSTRSGDRPPLAPPVLMW